MGYVIIEQFIMINYSLPTKLQIDFYTCCLFHFLFVCWLLNFVFVIVYCMFSVCAIYYVFVCCCCFLFLLSAYKEIKSTRKIIQ